MCKNKLVETIRCAGLALSLVAGSVLASEVSGLGGGFNEQDFYKPFSLSEINSDNMQKWPYNRYVFSHWEDFAAYDVAKIPASDTPVKLTVSDEQLDLNVKFENEKSFISSLQSTQTAAFVVLKDNKILAEYYDNGVNVNDTYIMMSAAKTVTAIVVHKLIDEGLIDVAKTVEHYLPEYKGSDLGKSPIQNVLDMTSGLPHLFDYHTPGSIDQQYEFELGMQIGKPIGLVNVIKQFKATANPGEMWAYNDMNTDTLAILASKVSGKKFEVLLSELFNEIGTSNEAWLGLTSEGLAGANCCTGMTARDYALFHQWIAEKKAPKSFYESALDKSKDLISKIPQAKELDYDTYGSQTYHWTQEDLLYSNGSFGQVGFSDLNTGISIVFYQAWAINTEPAKLRLTKRHAAAVINLLRQQEFAPVEGKK